MFMENRLIEQGWTHDPSDGFLELVGGIWHRELDGQRQFGFLARPIHANRNGVVHGGMLMTFVDRAFGMSARMASGAERAATVNLNNQFMSPMEIGSFATITPRVAQLTRRLAFMEGSVMCGDVPILSAQGIWRLAARQA